MSCYIAAASTAPTTMLYFVLFAVLVFIVVATGWLRIHPFLVLIAASYGLGLTAGLSPQALATAIASGLGGTLGNIGVVIACGAIIGVVLERSGAANVMAARVLRAVGERSAPLALGITGALVSIPVFCDSGYILLSPLLRSLSRTGAVKHGSLVVMLGMGLYTTHCLVPPTPGPVAAAAAFGVDMGLFLALGVGVSAVALGALTVFARFAGRYTDAPPTAEVAPPLAAADTEAAALTATKPAPSFTRCMVPVAVPVLLMTLRSVAPAVGVSHGPVAFVFDILGQPSVALVIGAVAAFLCVGEMRPSQWTRWIEEALRSAGPILLVTGAGGALGGVLKATPLVGELARTLATLELGPFSLCIPFITAAALKTMVGSSTVSIATTAPLIAPLAATLGFSSPVGLALAALSTGAGSMVVSHANDSYFWVVKEFSGLRVDQTLRIHATASLVMGLLILVIITLLGFVLL